MKGTEPKKVAILLDDSFLSAGGAQTSIIDQARFLQAHNIAVDVICPDSKDAEKQYPFVHSVQSTPKFFKAASGYSQLWPRASLIKHLAAAGYDLIHCQSDRMAPVAARKVAVQAGIPLAHTFHGLYDAGIDQLGPIKSTLAHQAISFAMARDDVARAAIPETLLGRFSRHQELRRITWQLLAGIARRSTCFTTPSHYFLDSITAIEPDFAHKGFVVPNGIDPAPYQAGASRSFQRKDGRVRLITVSRLDSVKRIDTVLRAMTRLPEHVTLDVVGDGPQQRQLQQLVRELKLERRVAFHGFLVREEVGELLRGADIFLLASYHFETQGVVLLEAAAAGLPIVYCDERLSIGVSRKNALLTSTPNNGSFADAVNYLRHHPDRAHHMGQQSLRLASQHTTARMGQAFLRVYSQALRTHARK